MFRNVVVIVCGTCWALAGAPAAAQAPLPAGQAAQVNRLFDAPAAPGTGLGCEIRSEPPSLDFQLRFTAGYAIDCPLRLFAGKKTTVTTFVRVTPQGGAPVLLEQATQLPAMSAELKAETNPRKLSRNVQISGAFSVGEGRYLVEVLATDNRERRCRKGWKISVAERRGLDPSVVTLKPGAVAPAGFVPWEAGSRPGPRPLRLTVLLDAAPVNPREQRLRALDRVLLLQFLSSLLGRLPCPSVRLVAFNLDQQRIIFRDEDFRGGAEFARLTDAMESLELGTVSYRTLQKNQGWVQMLWQLAMRERRAMDPVDAVLFIGPATRTRIKIRNAKLIPHEADSPQFFYFEYSPDPMGGLFPDSMGTLTKALGGASYVFHSPKDLERDIVKMLRRLPVPPEHLAPTRWPARSAPQKPAAGKPRQAFETPRSP